jgi:hypothetical protein
VKFNNVNVGFFIRGILRILGRKITGILKAMKNVKVDKKRFTALFRLDQISDDKSFVPTVLYDLTKPFQTTR